MTTVFDNCKVMSFGNGHNSIHIAGISPNMDYHDSTSSLGDTFFDILWIDAEGIGFYFAENRYAMLSDDGSDTCPEGIGRNDDFILWCHAYSKKGTFKSRCTIVSTQTIGGSHISGKTLGELSN